jgi:phosphatidate cytidylyltransferase
VSEQEAAPAAAPEQGGQGSNLLTRIAAALVLAPIAILCAYIGGWLWIALVTLVTIGLLIEWQ